MSRRLKRDIPGPDWRVTLSEIAEKGWPGVFGASVTEPLPLVVELGFGRGEFLLGMAAEAPGVAHVGVEVSSKRVLKMARRLARTELGNVRLVHERAETVVSEALAPGTVRAFWINFSDPWPKHRHHPRRLVQPALVAALCERLVPGGELHIATDDVPYAEHIDETLRGEAGLANAWAPDRWRPEVPGRRPTAYELEWRALGRPLHFWCYRRQPTSR